MRRCEAMTFNVIEQSGQWALLRAPGPFMSPLQIGLHTGLHAVPELLLDDGRLLPRERLVFVRDLAQVDPVLKHLVEGSPREHCSARSSSISADSLFAPNSLLFEVRAQLRHTALFQI